MRNKGFTLVELLGVIVLLGILGIVIIPKVGDSITNSKETALKTQEESIKKAAYDFLVDNTEFLEENDTITIKLGVLKQKGYLPVNIKNPKTRKNISNESLITITKIGGTYKISLALIDLENVTENIDNNSPILVLNGDYVEYIEVNDLYQEKGAVAKSSTGQRIENVSIQIKQNNQEKTTVDTSQLLTYNVIYSATDASGKTTSATRTVIVKDGTAPTITFPTETILHISEVADFNIMDGVKVTDNYSTNPSITTNSSLAQIPGNYIITYTATDESGNQTIERRVINVDGNFANYYETLEYIESTGTQYIDTGLLANQNTGFEIKFKTNNDINNSTYGSIFGARQASVNNELQVSTYSANSSLKQGVLRYGTNGEYNADIGNVSQIQTVSLRNKVYTGNTGLTHQVSGEFITPVPLTIFALNQNGSIIQHGSMRLYYFKLYDGDNMVRNFVPCKRNSDDAIGLYDEVNDVFYTNQGTGTFTAGNPIN